AAKAKRAGERAESVRERLRSTVRLKPDTTYDLADTASAPSYPVEGGWWSRGLDLRSSFTHPGYVDAVARVREYIFAGDIFQANLSQRFEAPLTESPWDLYRRL